MVQILAQYLKKAKRFTILRLHSHFAVPDVCVIVDSEETMKGIVVVGSNSSTVSVKSTKIQYYHDNNFVLTCTLST